MGFQSSIIQAQPPVYSPFTMEGIQALGTVSGTKFTLANIIGQGKLKTAMAYINGSGASAQLTVTADGVKIFDGKLSASITLAGIIQETQRRYNATSIGVRSPTSIGTTVTNANPQAYPYTGVTTVDVWTPITGEILFTSSLLVELTQLSTTNFNCFYRTQGVKV